MPGKEPTFSTHDRFVAYHGEKIVLGSSATCGGPTYWSILVVALATRVGGYLAVNYALGYLCASIASPALLGQPVIMAILGVPLLGQPVTALQIIGGIILSLEEYWSSTEPILEDDRHNSEKLAMEGSPERKNRSSPSNTPAFSPGPQISPESDRNGSKQHH